MVRYYCCVPGCGHSSQYNPDLVFHNIPRNVQLQNAWLKNIKNPAFVGRDPQNIRSYMVCSAHFTPDQYKSLVSRKLITRACPTIFTHEPPKPTTVKRKLKLPVKISKLLRMEQMEKALNMPALLLEEPSTSAVTLTATSEEFTTELTIEPIIIDEPVTDHTTTTTVTPAIPEGDSCYSYAGGSVYPQEADPSKTSHKLQWTKAVISQKAPQWEATAVVQGEFTQLKLSDFLGKYVVFFFYPLDFTFVCPTEILAFSDRVEEFRKLNTEVVACSVDSHFTHLAWINTPRKEGGLGKVNIPLVSDLNHNISKDYGVFLEEQGHTLRGLFIIDQHGVLRQITMNDLPVGRSVDETLRLVQAFQYTDNHGEVCPAGWKPGQDTIIPNPVEKKKYFEKH